MACGPLSSHRGGAPSGTPPPWTSSSTTSFAAGRSKASTHCPTSSTCTLGPVRRLAIGRLNPHNKTEPRLHYWFLSLALDLLEELKLHGRHPCSLPSSVFHLAPMLHRATFKRCISPRIDATHALHLSKLKHLELIVVRILKEDLERLLVGCTTLEYLRLHAMNGFGTLHITSTNVRAIYVHCWRRPRLSVEVFHDIVIENEPFLERLYVHGKLGPARIRVIHAPKLTVLGYSCAEFKELFTGSLFVQVQQSCSSPYILLDNTFYLFFVDLYVLLSSIK